MKVAERGNGTQREIETDNKIYRARHEDEHVWIQQQQHISVWAAINRKHFFFFFSCIPVVTVYEYTYSHVQHFTNTSPNIKQCSSVRTAMMSFRCDSGSLLLLYFYTTNFDGSTQPKPKIKLLFLYWRTGLISISFIPLYIVCTGSFLMLSNRFTGQEEEIPNFES